MSYLRALCRRDTLTKKMRLFNEYAVLHMFKEAERRDKRSFEVESIDERKKHIYFIFKKAYRRKLVGAVAGECKRGRAKCIYKHGLGGE